MSILTKVDIMKKLADKTNSSQIDAKKNIETILGLITENLKTNDKIQFTGFGTFLAENKPASEGRNPKTGEKIKISARRAIRFKVGDLLKKGVN